MINYKCRKILKDIKQRCTNPNNNRYKNYGARGIKCLITKEEIKRLWFRDKAWLLKQPSIDRKKNDKDYTLNNCRFIELGENSAKDKRKPILQFDLNGEFIKEYISVTDARKKLKLNHSHMSECALGKLKTSNGYIWKYKKE